MNLNDLETFVLVAEEGTFSGAAERLDVPKSTVSRRVSRLEEDLGIALLKRSARSIALSDDGRALAERCTPAIRELGDVQRGLLDSARSPRGVLRLTAAIDLGNSRLLSRLVARYGQRYPEVRLELDVTNRVVDLLEEGFDLAFRIHAGPLQDGDDLVMRSLTEVPLRLYASPDYLAENGRPNDFADLGEHPIVAHETSREDVWPTPPSVVANDYGPVASILGSGLGIGGLPAFVAEPFVASGKLEEVEVEHPLRPARLSLVWLRSRHMAPRVRAFIDLVTEGSG